jgi:hypothetical protein
VNTSAASRGSAAVPQATPTFERYDGVMNRSPTPARFVADPPLEGDGFEPSVPVDKSWILSRKI